MGWLGRIVLATKNRLQTCDLDHGHEFIHTTDIAVTEVNWNATAGFRGEEVGGQGKQGQTSNGGLHFCVFDVRWFVCKQLAC